MTTQDVCKQLDKLFQDEIKRQGLVKSGRLLRSIKWSYSNAGFNMSCEDYYTYLDAKHKITENVLGSQLFKDILEKYYAGIIEDEITPNK